MSRELLLQNAYRLFKGSGRLSPGGDFLSTARAVNRDVLQAFVDSWPENGSFKRTSEHDENLSHPNVIALSKEYDRFYQSLNDAISCMYYLKGHVPVTKIITQEYITDEIKAVEENMGYQFCYTSDSTIGFKTTDIICYNEEFNQEFNFGKFKFYYNLSRRKCRIVALENNKLCPATGRHYHPYVQDEILCTGTFGNDIVDNFRESQIYRAVELVNLCLTTFHTSDASREPHADMMGWLGKPCGNCTKYVTDADFKTICNTTSQIICVNCEDKCVDEVTKLNHIAVYLKRCKGCDKKAKNLNNNLCSVCFKASKIKKSTAQPSK